MSGTAESDRLWGKSVVLGRLRGNLQTAIVDEGHIIVRSHWDEDLFESTPTTVLTKWMGSKVILRSDAYDEDQPEGSQAGRYESIIIDDAWTREEFTRGVNRVFSSYDVPHPLDSVLVQQYVIPTATAVVTTCMPVTGAPYVVAAVDSAAASSDGVTSGLGTTAAWYILGGLDGRQSPEYATDRSELNELKAFLNTSREVVEQLQRSDLLIELLLDQDGKVHLLQARPLLLSSQAKTRVNEDVSRFVKSAQATCESLWAQGSSPILSNTSDWNPAEMIGSRPESLAISLYKHVITDSTWARQRVQYGYTDQTGKSLMSVVTGHPFIDVASSLRSFVPARLPTAARERLLNHQLEMISNDRSLHTSLEFDVAISSADFGLERRLRGWPRDSLTSKELTIFRAELGKLTSNGIRRMSRDIASCSAARRRREAIQAEPRPQARLIHIIDEIETTAALPFAHLARGAFVATSFIRSASEEGLAHPDNVDALLRNVGTISSRLRNDGHDVYEGKLSWPDFVQRYGHLRPGTYDIREISYSTNPELYLAPFVVQRADAWEPMKPVSWLTASPASISSRLSEVGLLLEVDALQEFVSGAIRAREAAKFELSAWVSAFHDAAIAVGKTVGLSLDELAASTVFELRELALHGEIPRKSTIAERRTEHELARLTHLPSTILAGDDLTWFRDPPERVTYVGQRTVTGRVQRDPEPGQILDGIVVVDQADPGWEWLFSQPLMGIITAQGGSNSHLAVRCAELGLPAAIGLGQHQVRTLSTARVVRLDPINGRVEILM